MEFSLVMLSRRGQVTPLPEGTQELALNHRPIHFKLSNDLPKRKRRTGEEKKKTIREKNSAPFTLAFSRTAFLPPT